MLKANNTADVLFESSLVANGSGLGLIATAGDGARLVVSQTTTAGNGLTGVLARGFSTVPLRIEGSVLWGNGAVNDDLELFGTVDADRVANHNWIGDQGDPDPLFVDPANGDFGLQALSAAVDAGDATFPALGPFDLAHAPRVVGAEVDLGALERDGLFADNFESASTGAWSTSIP